MSPQTMNELFSHLGRCSASAQDMILAEIDRHGANRALQPLATAYNSDDKQWYVYVEVDSLKGTFDVETHAPDLYTALCNALTRVRRSFTTAAA